MSLNRWDQIECVSCRKLSRGLARLQTRQEEMHKVSLVLHTDLDELDSCAIDINCAACQVFRRALLLAGITVNGSRLLQHQGKEPLVLSIDLVTLKIDILVGAGSPIASLLLSNSDVRHKYPKVGSTDPLHPRRIARIRDWLSVCHEQHLCGNFKYSRRSPTWLISILGNGSIRIVEGQTLEDQPELIKYVALSYCWGDEASISSKDPDAWKRVLAGHTTDTAARQGPFPLTDLPETLQDAISITHALGLEYIWIDSVCVPRGTWDLEANRMHEVYGNAFFTLTSASTKTALDRMLVPREAWRDASRGVKLHDCWLLNTDASIDEIRTSSPVATRAWVLQEERLSPRILYWCAQRAYWTCTEACRIEAPQPGGQREPDVAMSPPQNFIQVCRAGSPGDLAREWSDLVAVYSRRQISKINIVNNRFAAFSGLAVRYLNASSGLQDTYLAGLWKKTLASSLAWTVNSAVHSGLGLQYAIPSWSWLSLPPGTDMTMPSGLVPSPHFEHLDPSVVSEVSSDRAIVAAGALVRILILAGRMRPLIHDLDTVQVPWDGIEREVGSFDFSLDPGLGMFARHKAGRVLLYEAYKEEVIGQLDYLVSETDGLEGESSFAVGNGGERRLYCFESCVGAALLVQWVSDLKGVYRRVGAMAGYRESFFADAKIEQISLV